MGLLCAPAGATPNAKATPSVSTVHNQVAILIRSRLFQCGVTAVNEFRRAYSPPCKGGVAAPSKKWSRSEPARTGWSLASDVSEMRFETFACERPPRLRRFGGFATFY